MSLSQLIVHQFAALVCPLLESLFHSKDTNMLAAKLLSASRYLAVPRNESEIFRSDLFWDLSLGSPLLFFLAQDIWVWAIMYSLTHKAKAFCLLHPS